jgi:hypothetical protein
LIFDDPAELEKRQCPKFYFFQPNSTRTKFSTKFSNTGTCRSMYYDTLDVLNLVWHCTGTHVLYYCKT